MSPQSNLACCARAVYFLAVSAKRAVIVGGGAAGFFAAIACAEQEPEREVIILERGPQFLAKVRISGGGRCNVTHHCFDARELSTRFPRGDRALIGLFQRFQASHTVEWFQSRGVALKTEKDGRMFPATDSSQTVIDCLQHEARKAGVQARANCLVENVARQEDGSFVVTSGGGEQFPCDRLLLATGGARTPALARLATALGHSLVAPVPSLFTFHVDLPWLRALSGVAVEVGATVPGTGLRERGPMLITHWGVSGPAILRLSAWGARLLHERNYDFVLHVNWLPEFDEAQLQDALQARRHSSPAKPIAATPVAGLPARLWESLVRAAGIDGATRWAGLSRAGQHVLVQQLLRTELRVTGKSLNKDEFVTCGGVPLHEVDLKTMQSRICPGLFFAGELLDIDGITGGFNFQAAWTTGWIAGRAMAA